MFSFFRRHLSTMLVFTLSAYPLLGQAPAKEGPATFAPSSQAGAVGAGTASDKQVAPASASGDEQKAGSAVQSKKMKRNFAGRGEGKRRLLKYGILAGATAVLVWVVSSHRAT